MLTQKLHVWLLGALPQCRHQHSGSGCAQPHLEQWNLVATALESFWRVSCTPGFASGLEDAFQQISPPPVSPPVKGDALRHQALYEARAAGSTGNTHSTTLPTPVLITSYLENALIDLSFLLFSTVPIFALLVSVQASPCVPNHLKLYCCLHLHPHLLLFHQLLHV